MGSVPGGVLLPSDLTLHTWPPAGREVWNWSGNHLSQTPAALDWQPTFFLQELAGHGNFTGMALPNRRVAGRLAAAAQCARQQHDPPVPHRLYAEEDAAHEPRLIMPLRCVAPS